MLDQENPRKRGVVIDQILRDIESKEADRQSQLVWEKSLLGQLMRTSGDSDPYKERWGRAWSKRPDGEYEYSGGLIKEEDLSLVKEVSYGDQEKGRRLFVFRDEDYYYLSFGFREDDGLEGIRL